MELLRVSTDLQAGEDRAGLAGQHAANVQTCRRHGLEPVACIEIVESGATVARSPQMRQALDMIQSGTARGIVLAEYSRLFRPDRWADFEVLQTLQDCDACIYLPSGPIDLQSELGYVQATVNNLLAAMERRRIRERMDRGKEEHRRRGAHVAGGIGIPFGLAYSRENGWTYTPDIERVRDLFRRFLAGEHNMAALARATALPRTTCRFLLGNPVYTGWRVYDERRASGVLSGRDRRKVARAEQDIIRVRLPLAPIVSDEDFALVQQIIADEAERRTRRTSAELVFLYRGFVRCAHDSEMLYGNRSIQKRGDVAYSYVCRQRAKGLAKCPTGYMRHDRLHAVLDAAVAEHLADTGLLAAALASHRTDTPRTARPDLAAVQNQLGTLQGKRARTLELYVDGLIDRAERDRRVTALDAEASALTRLLDVPAAAPEASAAALCAAVAATFAEWRYLEPTDRRSVLEAASPVFYVKRYDVQGVSFPLRRPTGNQCPAADSVAPSRLYIPLRTA